MTGRPTTYDKAIADALVRLIAEEGYTLNRACRTVGVAKATFLGWVEADRDQLSDRYAKAREALLEHWADEIVDVADETSHDTITTAQGTEVANTEWISRSRLRVDARKWLLSKLKPNKYGDKLTIPEGEDGKPAIPVFIMRLPGEN